MVREQEMLMEELAAFVNLVEGPGSALGLAHTKEWTVGDMVNKIFPVSHAQGQKK